MMKSVLSHQSKTIDTAGYKILQKITSDFLFLKSQLLMDVYSIKASPYLFYFNVLLAVGTAFSIEQVSLTIQSSEK